MLDLLRPHPPSLSRLGSAVLLSLAITVVLVQADRRRAFDFAEMQFLDWRFQERGRRPAPREVVIVGLDDAAMHGRPVSPVPRDLLARTVRSLSDLGARAIVLDVELRGEDYVGSAADEVLRDAMADARNVIVITTLDASNRPIPPAQPYRDAAARVEALAHVEKSDVDGIRRWLRPVDGSWPSVALAAWAQFRDVDLQQWLPSPGAAPDGAGGAGGSKAWARLAAAQHWPLDESGRMLIDYVGPAGSFPVVSAADVVSNQVRREMIRDRLALVGATWTGVPDRHPVPFGGWRVERDTSWMTGVELQANCVATLLAPAPLSPVPFRTYVLLVLATVLLISLAVIHFQPTAAGLFALLLGVGWAESGLDLFLRQHLYLRVAPPLAGILIAYAASALLVERSAYLQRRHFRRYFGREMADRIANMSTRERAELRKERVLTIVFTDLRGYTRLTSRISTEAMIAMINRYLACLTRAAFEQRGYVNRFMGDGMLAIFGVFSSDESGAEGAWDAVRAALAMRTSLEELRRTDPDFATLSTGIGIHTGSVVMGDVGSAERAEFTAMGSAVNAASRIETATKPVLEECRARGEDPAALILISGETYARVASRVTAARVGPVTLRGLEDAEFTLWVLQSAEEGVQTVAGQERAGGANRARGHAR